MVYFSINHSINYITGYRTSFLNANTVGLRSYCIVFIAPLSAQNTTEALLVRLASRKQTGFKKR